MDNKKFNNLKMCHMCLMVIAIIITSIGVINQIVYSKSAQLTPLLVTLAGFVRVLALFCGAVYLIFDYKKNVAGFYKAFINFMIVSLVLRIAASFQGSFTALQGICSFVSLVALLALEYAKDLGKKNTSIIYAVMLVCEIIAVVPMFATKDWGSILSILLLVGTLGLMITGKYIDKKARGRE